MRIRLLVANYFNNEEMKQQIYQDFLNNDININKYYFSEDENDIIELDNQFDLPIYLNRASKEEFIRAITILRENMVKTERSVHLSGRFWHSYILLTMRDYVVEKYPQVKEGYDEFRKVVLKYFDWENYIYKCMIAAEYIENSAVETEEEKLYLSEIIVENLDLYNYLIKYTIFRNKQFILNLLRIIDEEGVSEEIKKKVQNEAGKDLRLSRMIVYEMNKRYPNIMYPLLSKDELKEEFYEMKKIYS